MTMPDFARPHTFFAANSCNPGPGTDSAQCVGQFAAPAITCQELRQTAHRFVPVIDIAAEPP
jgi:hypothetical protein